MWSYADWDGDGDKDIVVGIDTWDDYGWDNAFDSLGPVSYTHLDVYKRQVGERFKKLPSHLND